MVTADSITWEDILSVLVERIAQDHDVTVAQVVSVNEYTGSPDWIVITTGGSEGEVSDRAEAIAVQLGIEL